MAVETLAGVPIQFRSGETMRVTLSDNDHPATLWTLAFTLRGKSLLTVAGVQDESDFTVVLTAAQTTALLPGDYNWLTLYTEIASAEKDAGVFGRVRVLPNLADVTIGPWRARYDAAVLASATLSSFQSVSVEGESYTIANAAELQNRINWLEMKALEEDRQRGISNEGGLRRIVTRM